MFQKISIAVTFVLLSFLTSVVYSSQTVNINTANAVTLAEYLNGIGASKARAIIEYRESNGKFGSIDELINVSGIGPKLVERNRSVITLGDGKTAVPTVAKPQVKSPAVPAVTSGLAKGAGEASPALTTE